MEMNDKFLDQLITETIGRQELEKQIESAVMNTIATRHRHAAVRRWARIAAFAFAVPALLTCFAVGISYLHSHVEMQFYIWIAIAVAALTFIAFLGREVNNFSIDEV